MVVQSSSSAGMGHCKLPCRQQHRVIKASSGAAEGLVALDCLTCQSELSMSSGYSRRQADLALSRAALGLFCLVLLLAPAVDAQSQPRARRSHRARHLDQRSNTGAAVRRTAKRNAKWCAAEVVGCNACFEDLPKTAPGAQFPGSDTLPKVEPIVRCTRCRQAGYMFNKAQENCDCAAGYGSAFTNGTLIMVETFDPPRAPTSMSDTLVFPDPSSKDSKDSKSDSKFNSNSSSSDSSKAPSKPSAGTAAAAAAVPEAGVAAGASVASFAEASAVSARVRPTLLSKDAQRKLQPAYRRRFEAYMRENGYTVRTTRRGTFILQQIAPQQQQQQQQQAASALRFSSTDASAVTEGVAAAVPAAALTAGVETLQEQPLVCMACRGNTVSIGGFIGGSYCMPCEKGTKRNADRSACVSVQ
ncbi:hypothetical protein OEZ86_013646 [Tetradesmus obliquus]|nr:hypothetical protein OEZ86_013646 [Tetradesmus obliquus]